MVKTEREHRQDIVDVGRLVHQKGWVAANDGNITIRLDGERILATPTGVSKSPRAMELYPRLISLPLYPAMTEEQVRYVGDAVKEVARANKKTRVMAARAG